MFKIENNQIWLTRGDTAEFRPIIEDYEIQEGDQVVFAVKRTTNNETPDIRIAIPAGDNIEFNNETTSTLSIGSYLYELKLETVDGDISTFASGRFNLLGDLDNGTSN